MSEDYSGRYSIIGPPGTGKTTSLTRQVRAIVAKLGAPLDGSDRSPVLLCSLTKTAAQELAGRGLPIPAGAVGTLHAHAYRALGRPKVVTSALAESFSSDHPGFALSGGAVKAGDDTTVDFMGSDQPGDVLSERYHLLRAKRVSRDDWPDDVAYFAEAWEEWKTSLELWDFTDLIESVVTHRTPPPFSPRVVIVDEAQDLSALELELAHVWGDHAGALILSGDPCQSLYAWRGAHPEALTLGLEPSRIRTLRQSYRVPARVQGFAMTWAKALTSGFDYEYRPRVGDDGVVVEGAVEPIGGSWLEPEDVINAATESVRAGRTAMICSTCSFMLKPTLAILKSWGVPFANPWRAARGDWNPLSTRGTSTASRLAAFLKPLDRKRPELWTWSEVDKWAGMISARGVIRHGKKKVLEEKAASKKREPLAAFELREILEANALEEIVEILDNSLTREDAVRRSIGWLGERLLTRSRAGFDYAQEIAKRYGSVGLGEPKLFVGTVHSFKGAEADDVFIFPDITSRAASGWHSEDPELRDPVIRTFYVALTRARRSVSITNAGGGHAVDLKRLLANMEAAA